MQEKLTTILRVVLNNAILFGIFVITLTFLIFLVTPDEVIAGAKMFASILFGLFSIVAGLMWKDLG